MNLAIPFVGFVFLASSSHAQERIVETQALRCGALTYIHTSLGKASPTFGAAMEASTRFYASLFNASRYTRLGVESTMNEIHARQDRLLAEYRTSWKSNPEPIVQEVALCNSWRAEFASRIVQLRDTSTPQDLVRLVGTPPKHPSEFQVHKWRPLTNQAFKEWEITGPATMEQRQTLRSPSAVK